MGEGHKDSNKSPLGNHISNFSLLGISLFGLLGYSGAFSEVIQSEMDMAVTKFQSLHIFRGYSDGSLGENNSVTRGELALVLDRYDTYKNTLKEATTCTGDIHPGVAIILQDQFGKSITRAVITADKWITDGWLDKDYKTIDVLTNGEYRFLDEEDGEFLITISKNGYSQYKETLNISRNHCHVNTQYRTVTLIKL